MITLVNVAGEGEHPRIVNVGNIIDISAWELPDGSIVGTCIRMACNDSRNNATGPFKITVKTPFAEIIKRLRFEALVVAAPVAKD